MKNILSCKKKRKSVELAAFSMANQLSAEGASRIKSWEAATTKEGVCFLKPVLQCNAPSAVLLQSPLHSKPHQVSIEAFGIVVTLYLQNIFENDSRFRDFSNGFQSLYRAVLSHPEMEPILATIS